MIGSAKFEVQVNCFLICYNRYTVYVEMACNGLFGAGQNGLIAPTDPNRCFTLQQVDIATFDRDVYSLIMDMEILHGIAKVILCSFFSSMMCGCRWMELWVVGGSAG